MKYLELLIEEARELSGNQRYDANSGVSQAIFVRYFKNAQDALQKAIAIAKSKLLLVESIIPVVNQQEFYAYPSDLYLQNIDTIEWSDSASLENWVVLNKSISKDRRSNENGWAFGYIPRKDGFLLTPTLVAGNLRVNYIKKLPLLEKRSGRISAVTVSSGEITAITLNIAEGSFDGTYINKQFALCIVDRNGDRKVLNVQYDSVDTVTGVITLASNHVLISGESVAVGDFITVGTDTYNRPDLADICESYLIKHAVYEAKYGDKSNWTKEAINDLAMNIKDLLESFNRPSDDINPIPIINTDYLGIG